MDFEGKPFEIPEEGKHAAIVADAINLGEIRKVDREGKETNYRYVKLVYFLKTLNSEGRQFRVNEQFSVTFGENSKLPKRLKNFGITSRGFNRADVIGQTGTVLIVHNEGSKGGTFANISKFTPVPVPVSIPSDYVQAPLEPAEAEEAAA